MQLICVTFRPLFLENICSRLLRNQMIVMLISHFHNLCPSGIWPHSSATRWILTKSPRCDRVNLCIYQVKGARSVIFVKIHISFLFHLKDRHSKDVNFKFHLKQSSNFVYCSCLYLILCKLKGALDKYNTYFYFNREFWIKPILKFSADSEKAFSFY